MKNSILGLGNDLHFFIYQKPVNMILGIDGLRGIIINELFPNTEQDNTDRNE